MAPLSPRRSSRARAAAPHLQQSPVSSATSSRIDKNVRRDVKKRSPSRSTPTASISSEPADEPEGNHPLRMRRWAGEAEKDSSSNANAIEMAQTGADTQEEDDSVRCICGSEEYPGLPLFDDDTRQGSQAADAEFYSAIELTEDITGFFVQCDACKVWQHGACVGIISAENSPDEYFCDQCHRDLHKTLMSSNGQRYSHYLPLHQASINASRATSVAKDASTNKAEAKASSKMSQASKRRSTMNSRDAAYDDEMFRRAIEASKGEATNESECSSGRRPKRGRSEGEENQEDSKRQRSSSQSASPSSRGQVESAIKGDSDDVVSLEQNDSSKKARSSRNQPHEKADRNEAERQTAEITNKKRARPDRRRADGLDHPSESRLAVRRPLEGPPKPELQAAAQPSPDTPPARAPTVGSSHKKNNRHNHSRKSKGRNQYSKDRDKEAQAENSPARSAPRDGLKAGDDNSTTTSAKAGHPDGNKSAGSKTKAGLAHHKMTIPELRRRVAVYLEFISRTQIDLAAEASPIPSVPVTSATTTTTTTTTSAPGVSKTAAQERLDTKVSEQPVATMEHEQTTTPFRDLSSLEMMDVLTRRLLIWQKTFLD